jgi:hypothetical protein
MLENAVSKKTFWLCLFLFCVALSVSAQSTVNSQLTEGEIAANKRRGELLLHPALVTLRLTSVGREPSTTPAPYTVGAWMDFDLHIAQSSADTLVLFNFRWPFYECRPELNRDGDILPYSNEAQEKVDRSYDTLLSGSFNPVLLIPNREYTWVSVRLTDWYEPLGSGHYQLTVRKRFVPNGDLAESNPVTFDVVPRRAAAPIPNGLKLRLVPEGTQPPPEGRPYRLGSEVDVAVLLVNDSDQRVRISVIDRYYGHRLQLFNDGKLIPYNEETAKLIESKEANPRMIEVVPDFFLDPKTSSQLDGLSLKKWYGPLPVGHYRLTDRRRFEIDGPWTADSAELWFEVVKQ